MSIMKEFGDLVEGDYILGSSGEPVQVSRVYDTHKPEKMYRLEFDNGVTLDASGNHLWYVETSLDKSLHKKRVKEWRRIFDYVSPLDVEELLYIAELDTPSEIALKDIIEFMHAEGAPDKWAAVVRVAESIGPVMEETTKTEDLYSGETVQEVEEVLYDAARFAQQLLALTNRNHEKRWPIIVGRVMTTEQISESALSIDFPEMRSVSESGKPPSRGFWSSFFGS